MSSSQPRSVGLSIQHEAMDVAPSEPQGAGYHPYIINFMGSREGNQGRLVFQISPTPSGFLNNILYTHVILAFLIKFWCSTLPKSWAPQKGEKLTLTRTNWIHLDIRFTRELEENKCPPFLEVLATQKIWTISNQRLQDSDIHSRFQLQ